jgi:hypothetical protein
LAIVVFKLDRTQPAEVPMSALCILEAVDVAADVGLSFFRVGVDGFAYSLLFEGPGKRLCDCVVPAISFSTHALNEARVFEGGRIGAPGVLATAVRVVECACGVLPRAQSVLERVETQGGLHVVLQRPSDNLAIEEVQNDR